MGVVQEFSNLEMSLNIRDSSDTVVTAPPMAPPTKRLMHWRKNGGVHRILRAPGRPLNSHALLGGYKVRLAFYSTWVRFVDDLSQV